MAGVPEGVRHAGEPGNPEKGQSGTDGGNAPTLPKEDAVL
jgi:hypothetical protein